MNDGREKFEKLVSAIYCFWEDTRDGDGYENAEMNTLWVGWRAGRDSMQLEMSQQEPVVWIDPEDVNIFRGDDTDEDKAQAIYATNSPFDGNTVALIIRPEPPTDKGEKK